MHPAAPTAPVCLRMHANDNVAIDAPDAVIPIRTLRNITRNPNGGNAVMVVGLGCEKLQPERLLPPGSVEIAGAPGRTPEPDVVCLQDDVHVGFPSMIDSILATARTPLERLNPRRRETCPASALVVGVQSGGSDAFSGVTANPAVGFCSDLLVREMAWYDACLARGNADRSDLARRWHDLMDIDAGRIADGQASVEDVGREPFHLLLEVASGRKQTWAEHRKLHNALALFNPAPIT